MAGKGVKRTNPDGTVSKTTSKIYKDGTRQIDTFTYVKGGGEHDHSWIGNHGLKHHGYRADKFGTSQHKGNTSYGSECSRKK